MQTFVFEFESGDVRVSAPNERLATTHADVLAKVLRGEIIQNVQRNPRGRANSQLLSCGCKRYIQRSQFGRTIIVDRKTQRKVCTGCGRPHK